MRQGDNTNGMVTIRPIPDPTELTTQQLLRELSSLQEVLETRISGIDKAMDLVQKVQNTRSIEIELHVNHLKELHDEKFNSIQTQFRERDTRDGQTQRDSKVAVDAALQAAKEAVGEQNKSSSLAIAKSEAATTKQIDQQAMMITSGTGALDGKINDIKDRLTAIENRGVGSHAAYTTQREVSSFGLSFVMGGVGLIAIILSLLSYFKHP